jgi:hypothetical protein
MILYSKIKNKVIKLLDFRLIKNLLLLLLENKINNMDLFIKLI